MKKANIFLEADSTSPQKRERVCGYVLEFQSAKGPITREGFEKMEGTYHQAVLMILAKALERFREPCEIEIHTEDGFVLNMIEHNLETWSKNGFLTSKGKPVANQREWLKVWLQLERHKVATTQGEHEYSEWLLSEMKKGRGL